MKTEHYFQPCDHCRQLSPQGDGAECCPVRENDPITPEYLEHLQKHTPFSQWQPPTSLAEQYGFTPRHISRLVSEPENGIAAVYTQRRWFILLCSFSRYMDRRQHKRKK